MSTVYKNIQNLPGPASEDGALSGWVEFINRVIILLSGAVTVYFYFEHPEEIYVLISVVLFADLVILAAVRWVDMVGKAGRKRAVERRTKQDYASYSALKEAYTAQRRMTHDFENHLLVLKRLLDEGEAAFAGDYINGLLENTVQNVMVVNSNNPIVDAVLNQKYSLAREDIVTILANALDNRITAAEKRPEKYINVSIKYKDERTMIFIDNTTDGPVTIKDNRVVKRTEDMSRGFGLVNITGVLEKYEHLFNIKYEGGRFCLSAIVY